MALDPALRARIQSLLDAHRVVLFMKGDPSAPQCGFSARVVGILHDLGVDFAHVDVLSDPEIRDGIKDYGDWPTIPQVYVDGQLVGGSDIVAQMADSGELQALLGLPAPDRTPPSLEVTPAALMMLRSALVDSGGDHVVEVALDRDRRAQLHLVVRDPQRIHVRIDDVDFQFDVASARRADGLRIDFMDDHRGRGLVIGPREEQGVRDLTPAQAVERIRAGRLVLVDVRPPEERALAAVPHPFETFDHGVEGLAHLQKDTPLAFLCHHGGRSDRAAQHFAGLEFTEVYNVDGGIEAWAGIDPAVPRY